MLTKGARLLLLALLTLLLASCSGRTVRPQTEADAAPSETAVMSEAPAAPARTEHGAAPGGMPSLEVDELDNYADAPVTIPDPLEGWNRFWFGFNDIFYSYVFRPVYRAYAFVTPQELRTGLKNALVNALFPVRFVNSLLQGKFRAAGVEVGRFIVNSTLGMGGLINVTRDKKTIVPVDADGEDFGQTLGVWGMGPGIYVVWPIIGPSTARDTVGRAADWLMDPLLFVPGTTTTTLVNAGIWAGLRFNAADDMLDTYDGIKNAAVDPYSAMRDMYVKYRQTRLER